MPTDNVADHGIFIEKVSNGYIARISGYGMNALKEPYEGKVLVFEKYQYLEAFLKKFFGE